MADGASDAIDAYGASDASDASDAYGASGAANKRIGVELWLLSASNSVAAERLPADAAGFEAALGGLVALTRRALPAAFSVHSLRVFGRPETWRLGPYGAPGARAAFRAAAAAIRAAATDGGVSVQLTFAALRVADVGGALRLELLDFSALTALPAADIDPVSAARKAAGALARVGRPTSARLVFAPGAALFAPAVPVAGAADLAPALAALLAGPDAAAAVAVDVEFSPV